MLFFNQKLDFEFFLFFKNFLILRFAKLWNMVDYSWQGWGILIWVVGGVRTHSVPWEGHLLETDQGWLSSLFYISYNFLKKEFKRMKFQ